MVMTKQQIVDSVLGATEYLPALEQTYRELRLDGDPQQMTAHELEMRAFCRKLKHAIVALSEPYGPRAFAVFLTDNGVKAKLP